MKDRIPLAETPELEPTSQSDFDDDDGDYDNFDDYPSDMDLDFDIHPYIRDELPISDAEYRDLMAKGVLGG